MATLSEIGMFNRAIKALILPTLNNLLKISTEHYNCIDADKITVISRVYAPLDEDFAVEVTFKIKRIN